MKRQIKKISLRSETIRSLTAAEQLAIVGGEQPVGKATGWSCDIACFTFDYGGVFCVGGGAR